jgi:flagellar hook-length control protein FliK
MAEERRIGIVADIATVTAMTKATALNAQTTAAAGAKAQGGADAPFDVLLQLMTLSAAPANDAGQPTALNDNADTDTQTDSASQTTPQAIPQTPQDLSSLIALLQSAAPQQPVQTDENAATQSATTGESGAPAAANETANAAAALSLTTQKNQTASSQPQAGDAAATDAAVTDAAATDAATSIAADAQSTAQTGPEKDAKPAAKNDQKKATNADSTAKSDPKAAPDAGVVVALAQQMQAATPTPQSSVGNAASAAVAADTPPVPSASGGKPTAARIADLPTADANSGTSGDAKHVAAGADNRAASEADTAKADAPLPDASKTDGAKTNANAAPAPSQTSPHNADQSAAQTPQSSVSGQSSQVAPSVTATAVQAPINTANAASVGANLQVAPRHTDAASTSTLDSLGTTIAANFSNGVKHFDIRMDPPELGRVDVHLSVDDSGKAQASLVVDKPQTLELLQRDASNLTRSLNDAGVSLSNNGLNFSLRGQDRQNDGGSVVKGRSRALSVKAVMGTDAISTSSSIYSLAPDSVRLDIRV